MFVDGINQSKKGIVEQVTWVDFSRCSRLELRIWLNAFESVGLNSSSTCTSFVGNERTYCGRDKGMPKGWSSNWVSIAVGGRASLETRV